NKLEEEKPLIDLKELLDLKNYKTQTKKIDDSTNFIYGTNDGTKISGKIDLKTNKKFGWWKINDTKTKNSIDVEMKIEDDKNSRNQFIYYSKGKAQSFASKFYKTKKELNTISYTFNFPKDTFKTKRNIFTYGVFDKNGELTRNEISIPKEKVSNIYYYVLDLSKYAKSKPLYIYGYFTESTYNHQKQAAENWDILTRDTLK